MLIAFGSKKWMLSVKDALTRCDMCHHFQCVFPESPNWVKTFKRNNKNTYENEWYSNAGEKSSLCDYINIKFSIGMEEYLLDSTDFYGCSLTFKARSNTLPLEYRIRNWSASNDEGTCRLCKDYVEDLRHFLFVCSSLNAVRIEEYQKLEDDLCMNGLNDVWSLFIAGDLDTKLHLMLGSDINLIYHDSRVILDRFCKSYLKRTWAVRNSALKP